MRRIAVLVLGSALLIGGGTSPADAQTAGTKTCQNTRTGAVRTIGANQFCSVFERLISAITAPFVGPTGPTGPT
ncbi:MAG: hypothetical protein Q8K63_16175, partial [Acidimicrobiales bacterium]|nr:hypothetical protein [Acidimicrobiales bacterium]